MSDRHFPYVAALAGMLIFLAAGAAAEERYITLASTKSTENSGLFKHILPRFTARSGIAVRVVGVASGAVFRLGERGDVDMIMVHARNAEFHFVAAGYGIDRRDVMHNDFVLIGPVYDPVGIRGGTDVIAALKRIAEKKAAFASRGDNSGTHMAERRYWAETGIAPRTGSGVWYFETGSGMGETLNFAAARSAHALTDRATWLSFKNRDQLSVLVQGDPRMFNPYAVILVNPERHPHVKHRDAKAFADWLTSPPGREAISDFRIHGQQVFFPVAGTMPDAATIRKLRRKQRAR